MRPGFSLWIGKTHWRRAWQPILAWRIPLADYSPWGCRVGHDGATKLTGHKGGSVVKNLPARVGGPGDSGLIPGSGRSPGGGNGNPLQYSCLENSMVRGASRATVHGVTRSWTRQLVVIHTAKSFSVVNEAEADVFLEFSCFFYDPVDVNLTIKSQSGHGPIPRNLHPFPEIMGVILPLMSLGNYPSHKNQPCHTLRLSHLLRWPALCL